MKKLICMITALVMCLSLAAPVFATEEDAFVPSITYKPNPEIVPVENENGEETIGVIRNEEGEVVDYVDPDCLSITPIAYVWDEEKEVPEEVHQLLTFVYEELSADKMELPYEKYESDLDTANMVIRDLFDARWACDEHKEIIEEEGVVFEITFDMGVMSNVPIYAMTYDEATKEWSPVVKTVNNGDGTVTCTFEHLCAVALSMPLETAEEPVGDETSSPTLWPWIVLLVLAVVAVVVVIFKNKKKKPTV